MPDIATVIIFVVTMLTAYFFAKKKSRLPPGPSRAESIKLLDSTPYQQLLLDWGRAYKDMFSVKITGFGTTIFLTSLDLIKKLFVQNAEWFSNRPDFWLMNYFSKGKGMTFGKTWRQARKFALHSMRDFGLGKHSIDERIQDEAGVLVEQFRSKNSQLFDPETHIVKSVSNIICSITFGKRYSHSDPDFEEILKSIKEMFDRPYNLSPLNSMPWLRHFGFLHNLINLDYFVKPVEDVRQFVKKEIDNHREDFDPGNIRDLVDLYLQAETNGSKDDTGMDEEDLFQVIMDLFLAGTDTTAGTLRWIILHLLHNRDAQNKCREEILNVIGTDKLPEYKERTKLPYVVATIQEALRIDTVALGSLFHVADKDFEIGEYIIPKGASLVANTRSIMHDKKLWGDDVDKFRLERWLDEDGHVRSVPEFIPFSIGKRACPGEQLARTELFINTVALLQKFSFEFEDPENPPKIQGTTGTTYTPNPFKIIAVTL